jgi:dolichyl-phosphate-mannose-protein mannosyltransferase
MAKTPEVNGDYEKPKVNGDYEKLIVVLLIAFGCIIRFNSIGSPGVVVFDEVHFGGFVSNYLENSFFQDVHPPLGKMLLTFAAMLGGYDGKFSFRVKSVCLL